VVNKIDLAPYVGVDLERMLAEAKAVRSGRPLIATDARRGTNVEDLAEMIVRAVLFQHA
jgi:urease accessory protein